MDQRPLKVWVLDDSVNESTFERLGDARQVADRLRCGVGVLLVAPGDADGQGLLLRGADHVMHLSPRGDVGPTIGAMTKVAAAQAVLGKYGPRLVLASGGCHGREWAARLAVRAGWRLASPALMAKVNRDQLEITALDRQGRYCRRLTIAADETAVMTLRLGVAEQLPGAVGEARRGQVERQALDGEAEPAQVEQVIPADPASVDIRYANRLVSGGRGLGGKEGFEKLRRFADRLHAGVAASRMAVDLGWIEYDRQVGQTGRTVKPDLYIACGISGASHHLEGMSDAKHVIAINTDAGAPIMKLAHLALVSDLYRVLEHAEEGLTR